MAPVVLYLSDLHFGGDWNEVQSATRDTVLGNLIEIAAAQEPGWRPACVCISGDIAYSGTESDFRLAEVWIRRLLDRLKLSFADLILCPGNHDIDRSAAKLNARPSSADEADMVLGIPVAKHLQAPFKAYLEFCKRVGVPSLTLGDHRSFIVGQRLHQGVRFVVVNSAWFCRDKDDRNNLWIGLPLLRYMEGKSQLPVVFGEQAAEDITVALLHHPGEWLHETETCASLTRMNTMDYLARRCHLLLTGHTHGEIRRADRIAEAAWHLSAGAAYAGAAYFNSFKLIRLAKGNFAYRSFEFEPRSTDVTWKECWPCQTIYFANASDLGPTVVAHASIALALMTSQIKAILQEMKRDFIFLSLDGYAACLLTCFEELATKVHVFEQLIDGSDQPDELSRCRNMLAQLKELQRDGSRV